MRRSHGSLMREAEVLSRFLTGATAAVYAQRKYAEGHAAPWLAGEPTRFDVALVRVATAGRWPSRCADAYARLFAPRSLLRRKLVLLLAILECSPPSHRVYEEPDAATLGGVATRIALEVLAFVAALVAGTVVLAPLHLLLSAGAPGARRAGQPSASDVVASTERA